jgi:hypothetical protein
LIREPDGGRRPDCHQRRRRSTCRSAISASDAPAEPPEAITTIDAARPS